MVWNFPLFVSCQHWKKIPDIKAFCILYFWINNVQSVLKGNLSAWKRLWTASYSSLEASTIYSNPQGLEWSWYKHTIPETILGQLCSTSSDLSETSRLTVWWLRENRPPTQGTSCFQKAMLPPSGVSSLQTWPYNLQHLSEGWLTASKYRFSGAIERQK